MISYEVRFDKERLGVLRKRIDDGLFRSLGHTAAAIRGTAMRLIVRSREPAPPGQPVHTRGLAKRRDAILFEVDRERDDALIGFTYAVMGESMGAHEHGGGYMGGDFPQRPTMGPALEVNLVRFADEFYGSIGE